MDGQEGEGRRLGMHSCRGLGEGRRLLEKVPLRVEPECPLDEGTEWVVGCSTMVRPKQ